MGDAAILMARAGQAAWQCVLARWPDAGRIVVACGPGSNGGDGYELACHARQAGREVVVVRLADHAPRTPLAMQAAERYSRAGGPVTVWAGDLPAADVVVDAVFGIGFARTPSSEVAELLHAIAHSGAPVLALDVPSGVDADTGAASEVAIRADVTLEFLVRKCGLVTGRALDHVGECLLADLGVQAADRSGVVPAAELLAKDSLWQRLPRRARDSHKGRHGRVVCVGGDLGHGGAILLAAEAALRAGAGLVEVLTRPGHVAAMLARRPEAMARGVTSVAGSVVESLQAADVVAIGPGLGQQGWGRELFEAALGAGKPLVLDADALGLLGLLKSQLPPGCILTPHPGEAARLLDTGTAAIQGDRFGAACQVARRFNAVVVLKGAGTLVTDAGSRPSVINAGNPGMAVGGMGDVLTGVVASLRAQGLSAHDAASTGALLHAVAGDEAIRGEGPIGLLPADLMPVLRRLRNPREKI